MAVHWLLAAAASVFRRAFFPSWFGLRPSLVVGFRLESVVTNPMATTNAACDLALASEIVCGQLQARWPLAALFLEPFVQSAEGSSAQGFEWCL